MTGSDLYYFGYTPVGDILVLATVIIFGLLLQIVYVRLRREINALKGVLVCTSFAAIMNLLRYVFSIDVHGVPAFVLYMLRSGYFLLLFGSLFFYMRYIEILLQLDKKNQKSISMAALVCVIVFWLADIVATLTHTGFYYGEGMSLHKGNNILFAIEYVILVGMIFFMIKKYGERIYKPLVRAFVGTTLVSVLIMIIQGLNDQRSFTTATFIYPAFAVLYILHSNPFDPELGAMRVDALDEIIKDAQRRDKQLVILSYYLHEYDQPGKIYPEEVRRGIRTYITKYLKGASLVQISNGRMILLADKGLNPEYKKIIEDMLKVFGEFYEKFRQDYKIIVMRSRGIIKSAEDCIQFMEFIEDGMRQNDIYYMEDEDFNRFEAHNYVLSQLQDIHNKRDLHDERVTVFCQPVYNVITGKFDTAEALMRLTLPETGMVFPDKFIPLAEKHNYIHVLSMIILSKTCRQIRRFMEAGYEFERISVNFSILDFREDDFCEAVIDILNSENIPFDKVAIEVTESQNEKDFRAIKEKFEELRRVGITLYLDDFGTGYSSFERIIEIPFDIIKFDRSLVIASGKQVKAETTVSYLAHMFTDLNYSVLYEGIENEDDENRCNNMYARYLQGYKYSKPIPIERLTEFFEKREKDA